MSVAAEGAVRYQLKNSDVSGWFGPLQPLPPVAQTLAHERAFDFPTGWNIITRPRSSDVVSFADMRALADGYDLMRLVIETRKDQMVKLDWKIVPRDPNKKSDDRCKELQEFLRYPDKEHDWQTWLRMLLEEVLVIDAATVFPRRTRGNGIYSIEIWDGSTIKRVIDADGLTPLPPDPAYQKILKGLPAVDYTRDELIYKPRNVRRHKFYGYSPVEQVIMTVNIALRRQLFQLANYTDGTLPDAFMNLPKEWNTDQVKQFQQFFDTLTAENRRRVRFVPGDAKYSPTKDVLLKDDYDEWLARVVCFAFSINAQAFIRQINRGEADVVKEQALMEGLHPIMKWTKDLIDLVIEKHFGYADLEFNWDLEEDISQETQARIDDARIKNGTLLINDARKKSGQEPVEGGDVALIFTGTGVQRLEDIVMAPEDKIDPLTGLKPGEQDPNVENDPQNNKEKKPPTKEAVAKAKKALSPSNVTGLTSSEDARKLAERLLVSSRNKDRSSLDKSSRRIRAY
jgi:hypothetical protein